VSRDRIINQRLSHHPCEDPDEVTAILPNKILFSNQPKESLVHERGSLKRMSCSFAPEKFLGQTTQIIVNSRHHLTNRVGVVALGVTRLTHNRQSHSLLSGRRRPVGVNRCHNGTVYSISRLRVHPELIVFCIDALVSNCFSA
jgi:hypothetical protein